MQTSSKFGVVGRKSAALVQLMMAELIIVAIHAIRPNGADNAPALHKHLCLEDDYTNDLPIFIERLKICNSDTGPITVYTIKTVPDSNENKYCLKGN
jgi:hypothetical protein